MKSQAHDVLPLPTPTNGRLDSVANLTDKLIENKKGQLVKSYLKTFGE